MITSLGQSLPAGDAARAFESFGLSHFAAMAVIAALAVGLPAWARRAASQRLTRALAWSIAAVLVLNELVYYAHGLATMSLLDFARERLPVHVCDVAVYLIAWALCRGGRRIYELAYYWGLGGTTQAILTPNIVEASPSYEYFRFFVNHGGIVIGVLFATLALRLRPSRASVLRVIVISNLYLLFAAAVNGALGANYMFLCKPPVGASPFFFLPWPWYIVFLELVGIAMVLLLYLPFFLRDRLRGRLDAP
jgi:hypothetical integral membrane protein (TIGR02206 family)